MQTEVTCRVPDVRNNLKHPHRKTSQSSQHKNVLLSCYCPIEVQTWLTRPGLSVGCSDSVHSLAEAARDKEMTGTDQSDSSHASMQQATNPSSEANGGCSCCIYHPQTGEIEQSKPQVGDNFDPTSETSSADTVAPVSAGYGDDTTAKLSAPSVCASETPCCSSFAEQKEARCSPVPVDQSCCAKEDSTRCQSGIPSQSDRCQASCCANAVSPNVSTKSSCCGGQDSDRDAGKTGQDCCSGNGTEVIRSSCCERRNNWEARKSMESFLEEKNKAEPIRARCSQNTSCQNKGASTAIEQTDDGVCASNTSKIQVDVAQGLETCCRESSECECSGTDPLFLYTPDCTDKVFT